MSFTELINSGRAVLLDGAMGTQLDELGLMGRGRNNVDTPDAVLDVHRRYIGCGCDVITTNTLTMNRIHIETHNVGVDVTEVNSAGVKLAKEAAGDAIYVLGDISSTGQMLKPYGHYEESQFYETFAEQAFVLADAGVDAFIIETMFDLREALCAIKACKDNHLLPVICSIAFSTATDGGKTMMGNSAADCAKQLANAGANVIGANCGQLDPFEIAGIVAEFLKATSLPILAQPNAGKPQLINDATVFDMSPEKFAEGIKRCIEAGATLVGGCCGTTPEHIRTLKASLGKKN